MVRKRSAWMRGRERGRRRPKTPAPTTGWLVGELTALAQSSARSVRYYIERGVLPAPEFRGTSTRYQRIHLLRLLAVHRLQAERITNLATIRTRLDQMNDADLVTFVTEPGISDPVAAALQLPSSSTSSTALATLPAAAIGAGAASPAALELSDEGWRRIRLLPGLELHVATDASPLVHSLVRQIYEHCVGQRA